MQEPDGIHLARAEHLGDLLPSSADQHQIPQPRIGDPPGRLAERAGFPIDRDESNLRMTGGNPVQKTNIPRTDFHNDSPLKTRADAVAKNVAPSAAVLLRIGV